MAGDALQMATVKRALTGVDVVIQSLGISAGPENIFNPTRLFSIATRVLVAAMEEAIYLSGASMTTKTCRSASSAGASSTG